MISSLFRLRCFVSRSVGSSASPLIPSLTMLPVTVRSSFQSTLAPSVVRAFSNSAGESSAPAAESSVVSRPRSSKASSAAAIERRRLQKEKKRERLAIQKQKLKEKLAAQREKERARRAAEKQRLKDSAAKARLQSLAKRNPEEPIRPKSSFLFFFMEHRQAMINQGGAASSNDVTSFSRSAAEKWRSMNAEEKAKYQEQAKRAKEEYNSAMGEFHKKFPPAPKRPVTGFLEYLRARRPVLLAEDSSLSVTQLTKKVAEEWRALTAENKEKYSDKQAFEKYAQDLAAWKQKYQQK